MNEDHITMRLFMNPAHNFGFDIYIDKDNMYAEPIKFKKRVERYEYTPPALIIRKGDAQVLVDDLWSAGLRPTEGSGSAGSLAATQKHLMDMRIIAFKKLGIEIERENK